MDFAILVNERGEEMDLAFFDDIFIIETVKELKVIADKNGQKTAFVTLFIDFVEINRTKMEITEKEINLIFIPVIWKIYNRDVEIDKEIFLKGGIDCQKEWFEQSIYVKEIIPFKRMSEEEYKSLPLITDILGSLD
uniref:Uncharacterized protein n=1 Tax=uncultured bacterium contig00087 TaxID=1181560 RepID=A0A806K1X5_9BACT|nr:hypothetical protein [uncultured bacterium contig00087]